MRRLLRMAAVAALIAAAAAGAPASALALTSRFEPAAADPGTSPVALGELQWVWPAPAFRLERGFEAPAHEYAPGHRGIDVRPVLAAVHAPAAGVVAFSGQVAGRGILTIDHGDGLVTTLEPVDSSLVPGTPVDRGQQVGMLSLGGHAPPGALHFGVRLHGEYINPMLLLDGVPRAVLLPCC